MWARPGARSDEQGCRVTGFEVTEAREDRKRETQKDSMLHNTPRKSIRLVRKEHGEAAVEFSAQMWGSELSLSTHDWQCEVFDISLSSWPKREGLAVLVPNSSIRPLPYLTLRLLSVLSMTDAPGEFIPGLSLTSSLNSLPTESIQEIDSSITQLQHLLSIFPRSDSRCLQPMLFLGSKQIFRYELSGQREDLDKAILHLTGSLLLPPLS